MKLILENFNWDGYEYKNVNNIINILASRLTKLRIKFYLTQENNKLIFKNVEDKKLFVSTSMNKIMMKEDNPSIKKLGRNYKETYRPTEDQYQGFFLTILKLLDDIKMNCDVYIYYQEGIPSVYLRRGSNNIKESIPKLKSYPISS